MKALSTGVEGIGFAIPTAVIRPIVNALLADGRVSGRVSIGITVGAISSAASDYYDLPEGLYISDVAEARTPRSRASSPAICFWRSTASP